MRLALAVVSLLVLMGCGVVIYDQFHSRWEDDQMAYFNQALAQVKTGAERTSLEGRQPKIEQTIVTAFGDARRDAHRSLRELPHRGGRPPVCFIQRAAPHPPLHGSDRGRDSQRPLGAAAQVLRIRLHILPRRPGTRPGGGRRSRRGSLLALPDAGLHDSDQLEQGDRGASARPGVHAG